MITVDDQVFIISLPKFGEQLLLTKDLEYALRNGIVDFVSFENWRDEMANNIVLERKDARNASVLAKNMTKNVHVELPKKKNHF